VLRNVNRKYLGEVV